MLVLRGSVFLWNGLRMDYLTLGKLILAAPWLIYLSVRDFRTHELPNAWVFGGILVMLALALGVGMPYALASLLTAFFSSLFLLLPFFLRAAGAGDVKMLFAAGLIAGPGNTLNLILLVSLAGLVLAVLMLAFRKVNAARVKHYCRCLFDFRYDRTEGRKTLPPPDAESCRVPFGAAIAAGLFLNLLIQLVYSLEGAG